MSLTPVQRAEALLSEAVMILYSGYRNNDFPEHYISSIVPSQMERRLHELRTLNDPTYRFHRAKAIPPSSEPRLDPAGSMLQPLDSEGYRQLIEGADSKVTEAVDALWEGGVGFAQDYIVSSAQNHMAACLRWIRAQESPAERAALVDEVNRLRKSVGLGPVRWEEVVSVRPTVPS